MTQLKEAVDKDMVRAMPPVRSAPPKTGPEESNAMKMIHALRKLRGLRGGFI